MIEKMKFQCLTLGSVLCFGSLLVLMSGCASNRLTIPDPLVPRPMDSCEYRNVFVDPEDPLRGIGRAEVFRRVALRRAAEILPRFGLWIVKDRSDAYWRLFAEGRVNLEGNVTVRIGLSPELKLGREMFVVDMGDDEFPYRGDIGGSYKRAYAGELDPGVVRAMADKDMKWIWGRESEQITALCQARITLVEEGWAEIEELRTTMAEEMKRIRRERAREQQQKHLRLEVEETR